MFKLVFWGTSMGEPMKSRQNYSCIYLRVGDTHGLLDCGEGASYTHFEELKGVDKLDYVFITHMHPDHVTGLFMLIQFFSMRKRQKKLQIFLPESADTFNKALEMFYLFPQALSFELEVLSAKNVGKYYPFLRPFQNDHLQRYKAMKQPNALQSYGVNIVFSDKDGKAKRVCYTSDIASLYAIRKHIKGCDVCIVDGAHTPIDEFAEVQDIVMGRIYVTHGYTADTGAYLLMNPKKYELAIEGHAIKV